MATVRTILNDAVQAHIALLEAASDEGFAAAWEEAMQPTAGFWQLYLLLPLIAFPDEPAPDQRHEPALLLTPVLLAPALAALAFAPAGLRFGLTTWQGRHPAATRIIGYRVTNDANEGWLGLPVQPDGGTGGRTSLHRRTVQTLHLLFPLVLPVGGTVAQMGQAIVKIPEFLRQQISAAFAFPTTSGLIPCKDFARYKIRLISLVLIKEIREVTTH